MNCRPGPKLQKVLGKEELCGVPLKEESRRSAKKREDMGGITTDLIKKLGARFNVDEKVVAATSLSNLTNWTDTLHDAKGTQLTLYCS